MKLIDNFLNGITMYRLVLYCLFFLLVITLVLSFFGLLSFRPIDLIISATFLTVLCWVTNKVFAFIFKAQTNLESVYITALILVLIMTPIQRYSDLIPMSLVAVLSQASKYILVINKKHIFNPAALAVAFLAVTNLGGASWWVGNTYMMPFVFLGGLLVVRKLRRFSLVLSYLAVSLTSVLFSPKIILESPLLFFAFIMLTEPQTTPPTKIKQVLYGLLVGVTNSFITPEIALLLGNIFSYIVSPKEKLILILREKQKIAPDTYDFIFKQDKKLNYLPGQYMEWTYAHKNPDQRGVRRYFTLSSSPTEQDLKIGIKFYPNASSFKQSLVSSNSGDTIIASQLSGEFTLPKDSSQKLAFIAGGIGVTPFRSMIKYLLDQDEKRDIILLYSNKTAKDIVYKALFNQANKKLGIKTIYINTETEGFIDDKKIKKEVPDFKDRIFYISGPHSMVDAFEKTLKEMGLSNRQIKIDFFPGYA